MDIYEFFNSRDIAEHCRKINYKPTATEAAYIIYFSERHTLNQKHNAWQELIDTMPDEELPPSKWKGGRKETQLHSFLKAYIETERKYINEFFQNDAGYIYDYETYRTPGDWNGFGDEFYDNLQTCLKAAKDDISEDTYGVRVTKRKLYSKPRKDGWDEAKVVFNARMEILDIEGSRLDFETYKEDGFNAMYFFIPTPFERGDIVTVSRVCENENPSKFVLLDMPQWQTDHRGRSKQWYFNMLAENSGDWTDMQTGIYDVDDDGNIFWNHGPNYMCLEYFKGELEGKENILQSLSSYLKNKIDLIDFLTSYDALRLESKEKGLKCYFGHNEVIERLVGLRSAKEKEDANE